MQGTQTNNIVGTIFLTLFMINGLICNAALADNPRNMYTSTLRQNAYYLYLDKTFSTSLLISNDLFPTWFRFVHILVD